MIDTQLLDANRCKQIADAQLNAGNRLGALEYYEQAVHLRPDFAVAHNNVGIAWQLLGEWAKAETCHREAIYHRPQFARAYNNLGNALQRQEKWRPATEAFEQALALQPDCAEFAFN